MGVHFVSGVRLNRRVLDLVHSAVENPIRRFLRQRGVPPETAHGIGYIYVIGFCGPYAYSKVGSTESPHTRLLTLYRAGRTTGLDLAGVWLSPAHPDYRIFEKRALTNCRALSPSSTPHSEYFPGLTFEQARIETARAAYGFKELSAADCRLLRVEEAAAGQHERLPYHLRRKVDRVPPGPGDALRLYAALEDRFARGSTRTRFLRRNDPADQNGELLHLPGIGESLHLSVEACEPQPMQWYKPAVRTQRARRAKGEGAP